MPLNAEAIPITTMFLIDISDSLLSGVGINIIAMNINGAIQKKATPIHIRRFGSANRIRLLTKEIATSIGIKNDRRA
ncbi:hypothetical protein [Sphingobium yanoikuyae]|nr:hypothetical protein [Sphingobium yanoikuyae]WBQ17999.1 hypothetical protein PAE53_07330 [Sphingobium yanoikuyae]